MLVMGCNSCVRTVKWVNVHNRVYVSQFEFIIWLEFTHCVLEIWDRWVDTESR